jgi:hypothetical protein
MDRYPGHLMEKEIIQEPYPPRLFIFSKGEDDREECSLDIHGTHSRGIIRCLCPLITTDPNPNRGEEATNRNTPTPHRDTIAPNYYSPTANRHSYTA